MGSNQSQIHFIYFGPSVNSSLRSLEPIEQNNRCLGFEMLTEIKCKLNILEIKHGSLVFNISNEIRRHRSRKIKGLSLKPVFIINEMSFCSSQTFQHRRRTANLNHKFMKVNKIFNIYKHLLILGFGRNNLAASKCL